MTVSKPIRVRVTAKDIREGEAKCPFFCPAARALQRATRDEGARVVEDDYILYLVVGDRWAEAPWEVRQFVRAVDRGERDSLRPFSFDLPARDDPAWEEECCGCVGLFPPAELDEEGYCPECKETKS